MSWSHDGEDDEIVNEQAPHVRQRPSHALERLLGDREGDRKLRRWATFCTLGVGLLTLATAAWRGVRAIVALGVTISTLAATVQHFDPTVAELNAHISQLGARVDSLSAQEARAEAHDSARFAALEKATAAVNRATAAIGRRGPP